MLSCRELTEKAPAWLDGQLSCSDRMSIRLHLMLCVHCRRYVKQLEATRQVLSRLSAPELPATLSARLFEQYQQPSSVAEPTGNE